MQDGGTRSLRDALQAASSEGFAGVECSVALAHRLDANGDFSALMRHHALLWLPIAFSSGPLWRGFDPFTLGAATARATDTKEAHAAALAGQLHAALGFGLPLAPIINCHTGHDSFCDDNAAWLFEEAARCASSAGLLLAHETHRGRAAGSPWLLKRLVQRGVPFRLVADFSHFTCGCEVGASEGDHSLEAAIAELTPRVVHTHIRVSDECRAQVDDPSTGAGAAEQAAFEVWWRNIWEAQSSSGVVVCGATPEYGPVRAPWRGDVMCRHSRVRALAFVTHTGPIRFVWRCCGAIERVGGRTLPSCIRNFRQGPVKARTWV